MEICPAGPISGVAHRGLGAGEVCHGTTRDSHDPGGGLCAPFRCRIESKMTEFDARVTQAGDIVISRMSEHDLLEVVNIEENSGLSRWGGASYYAELQGANRNLMLVARPAQAGTGDAAQVIGYIVARVTA